MQLKSVSTAAQARRRIHAAACLLLAAGLPATATAEPDARWRFEGAGLLYSEKGRTRVLEPMAKITRLFHGGRTLGARFGFDAISGATPSGALPSGRVQTTTTPSGNVRSLPASQIPTSSFHDTRGSIDLEWFQPLGVTLSSAAGAHWSTEKDYLSLGANEKLSWEVMDRLTTLTVGGGFNNDRATPVGGVPVGLSIGELSGDKFRTKRVRSLMAGVSRVLTRRWMVGVNGTRTFERGYLTEPYKVVSLMDSRSGLTSGEIKEKRPSARTRQDLLGSSVYHFTDDVLYSSYRYYWDDWSVRSHTVDLRYRHELEDDKYLQPHLRFYTQSPAKFYHAGLIKGASLPDFASSDYRLGPLHTLTTGLTYGFRPQTTPGEFGVRAEYVVQWGKHHPTEAIGAQRQFDLGPPISIGSVLVTYTVEF